MQINNTIFNAELMDILTELQSQLHINGIQLLNKMKPTGHNIMLSCPYHGNGQEKRPSAGIDMRDGTFHCFACGEVHSLPEVISYCFGKDDVLGEFGWSWLVRNFLTINIEERKDVELDFGRADSGVDCDTLNSDCCRYVGEEELDEYRYYHPYWTKRGIVDEGIISLFDLGYDKQTDCITMPVRDDKGHTLFVARRSVKTKFFNYPKDVDKPLYGLYEYYCKDSKVSQVFICESMIDALLLWQAGYVAFALNGLGSSKQIEDLKRLPIRQYILCTDNDDAGQRAREVLRKALTNKLLTEIEFPSNRKDVGECTPEEIKNILEWEVM